MSVSTFGERSSMHSYTMFFSQHISLQFQLRVRPLKEKTRQCLWSNKENQSCTRAASSIWLQPLATECSVAAQICCFMVPAPAAGRQDIGRVLGLRLFSNSSKCFRVFLTILC